MLDRLFEFVLSCLDLLRFWVVLQPFERGVQTRLGKFVKVVEPGLTFIIPLGIDHVYFETVVPRTHSLEDQSCTTTDGKQIGFQAVLTYSIRDIEAAILSVNHHEDALKDSCTGAICHTLSEYTWDSIVKNEEVLDKVTANCRKKAEKYGIKLISVQFATMSLVRTIRLLNK
jgi:regulator of protease activity HflC (stomatin/prohibitin superfamily)